ncbi:MAG: radical SAM protein, partial [Pseudomonadota bacterium]
NQHCLFCKSSSRLENYAKPAQVADILERLARKVDFLTLSGGETCLDPWLEKHIEQARRAGFRRVEVQTNGLLMQDRDYVRRLLSAGMTNALVSLHSRSEDVSDSITRCKGGYRATLKGIETLLRERASVTLCHVICSLNYRDVPGYVRFIDRRFPRSSMCMVFTLAIPTFRVRSMPRLMPRLSDLAPPLKQGLLMCLPSNDAFKRSSLSLAMDKAETMAKRVFSAGGGLLAGILRAGTGALSGGRLRARVISHCGIPLCVLEGCEDYHNESAPAGSFPADHDLFHPPACASCKWRRNCSGIWRSYADLHGIEEVRPIQ